MNAEHSADEIRHFCQGLANDLAAEHTNAEEALAGLRKFIEPPIAEVEPPPPAGCVQDHPTRPPMCLGFETPPPPDQARQIVGGEVLVLGYPGGSILVRKDGEGLLPNHAATRVYGHDIHGHCIILEGVRPDAVAAVYQEVPS
jgi:hypothetical protein